MMNEYDRTAECTADLLGLSDVCRWGVIKTLRRQSVAEHCFNVMVLSVEIMERVGIRDSYHFAEMFWWAMIHDVPETLTGDIDGKFKRDYPAFNAMLKTSESAAFPSYHQAQVRVPERIQCIVKLADKLESLIFINVWGHGNRARAVYTELYVILSGMVPEAAKLLGVDETELRSILNQMESRGINESATIQHRPRTQEV